MPSKLIHIFKYHLTPKKRKRLGKTTKIQTGWQEWCALPKLHVPAIKAKIDTGAKTSALHAWDIRPFHRHGELFVHFILHPLQRDTLITHTCTARVVDERVITSSTGHKERRYIISTYISLGHITWEIELGLTNRDPLAFRMLLGRDAVRHHVLIDPAKIMCQGKITPRQLRKIYSPHLGHK